MLPFQISVQEKALTYSPGVFPYISIQKNDIKFTLNDIKFVLLMAHCAEGSAPPWKSQTGLS